MAKIVPVSLVASISGRICRQDDTHFLTNKQTGDVYAAKLCHPADQSNPSAEQQVVRNNFAKASAIAKAWRLANAPTDAQPNGTEEFQAMLRQYKAQHKIGNWFAFLRTKIKDGVVPSFVAAESATPPAGGGGTQGGQTPPASGGGSDTSLDT